MVLRNCSGRGIFLAPSFVIADSLATGELVRLLPDHQPIEFAINAIYQSKNHLSTKIRAFVDLLVEGFAEHRVWMSGSEPVRRLETRAEEER